MLVLLQTQVPTTLIMFALAGLLFYFMIIRPARRQMAAQKTKQEELRASTQPGSRVMLTSGLIGTVRHVGERQLIIELAPGVEVTVLKDAVSKLLAPEDEDFEYEDEAGDQDDQIDHIDEGGAQPGDEMFAPVISNDPLEPAPPASLESDETRPQH